MKIRPGKDGFSCWELLVGCRKSYFKHRCFRAKTLQHFSWGIEKNIHLLASPGHQPALWEHPWAGWASGQGEIFHHQPLAFQPLAGMN